MPLAVVVSAVFLPTTNHTCKDYQPYVYHRQQSNFTQLTFFVVALLWLVWVFYSCCCCCCCWSRWCAEIRDDHLCAFDILQHTTQYTHITALAKWNQDPLTTKPLSNSSLRASTEFVGSAGWFSRRCLYIECSISAKETVDAEFTSVCARQTLAQIMIFFIEILMPAAFDGRLGRRAEIEMLKSFANKPAGEAIIIKIKKHLPK